MILQELTKLYDRLPQLARPGYSVQQISFCLVLTADGKLAGIQDERRLEGKKLVNKREKLPADDSVKRTSGVIPMPFWDKSEYLLGCKMDASFTDKEIKTFSAWKDWHLQVAREAKSPILSALEKFLNSWHPSQLTDEAKKLLAEIKQGFGVIKLQGQAAYLHEDKAVATWWADHCLASDSDDEVVRGTCIITGASNQRIATLHPSIKGFADQQNIVAFNKGKSAYESLGNKDSQGLNAPISGDAAFKYTTALSHLLAKDSGRRISIGDMAVVFWSEQESEAENLFGWMFAGPPVEDAVRSQEVAATLEKIRRGQHKKVSEGVNFFVLGLSDQVKARLSIRFWFSGTVGEMLERVLRHERDLEIVKGPNDNENLPVNQLLAQTVRKDDDPPPLLGGSLLRAILTGDRYPDAFLAALLRRLIADRDVRHPRAAAIKAILNRNHKLEIPVSLDKTRPEPAYQLGRLFACLEKAQKDALPDINATIKDRFFAAASSTPGSVFPRLIRMNQHHVNKIDEVGRKVVAEKRTQEIVGRIDKFPAHLGLADQGLFAIGYYHQRQDFFAKKAPAAENPEAT